MVGSSRLGMRAPASLVAALLLVACGDSDDGDDDASNGTGTTDDGATTGGATSSGTADGDDGSGGTDDGGTETGDGTTTGSGTEDGAGGQPSEGCGLPWNPADAEVEEIPWLNHEALIARRSITVAGVERLYLLALPVDYDHDRAYPFIFGFHGGGGDREQLRAYMNIEIPAAGNAIVIYPEGLEVQPGSTGWELDDGSDDLAFVDTLLEKYSGELCLDLNQVLATGHSYGGCMSNTVGCFRGDVFRAIAPVAGCGPFYNAQCVGQIATLQIHSPKDTATPYGGAIDACTRYLRANTCEEDPACGCHWVDELESPADECIQQAQEPYETQVDMSPTDRDDAPAVARQYVECDEAFPVVFADHWYREDRPGQEERWHNPPPWSPALIWEFFASLPDTAPGG